MTHPAPHWSRHRPWCYGKQRSTIIRRAASHGCYDTCAWCFNRVSATYTKPDLHVELYAPYRSTSALGCTLASIAPASTRARSCLQVKYHSFGNFCKRDTRARKVQLSASYLDAHSNVESAGRVGNLSFRNRFWASMFIRGGTEGNPIF